MASRARQLKKNEMKGNMRMDAALDAARQLGFSTQLIRRTVNELLDVYGGKQGWPFIEEGSYKLLIETLLSKPNSAEHEDGARRGTCDGVSEAGSSAIVIKDTPLLTSDGLGSSSKVNASLGNLATDVRDIVVRADSGGHEQAMKKPAGNVRGSKDKTVVTKHNNNVKITSGKGPMIESSKSKASGNRSCRCPPGGCHGWLDAEDDVNDEELIYFPVPPLTKQIEKMIGQCEPPQPRSSSRRRKSRWDEKPEGM